MSWIKGTLYYFQWAVTYLSLLALSCLFSYALELEKDVKMEKQTVQINLVAS